MSSKVGKGYYNPSKMLVNSWYYDEEVDSLFIVKKNNKKTKRIEILYADSRDKADATYKAGYSEMRKCKVVTKLELKLAGLK